MIYIYTYISYSMCTDCLQNEHRYYCRCRGDDAPCRRAMTEPCGGSSAPSDMFYSQRCSWCRDQIRIRKTCSYSTLNEITYKSTESSS